MSHDFEEPRRGQRWKRRTCKRCGNVYSALHVETGMTPPCHGQPAPPPPLAELRTHAHIRHPKPKSGGTAKAA